MLKKSLLLGLMVIIGLVIAFPIAIQAQQDDSENFIFVNYIGQEIVLDLDDVTYIVPGTNVAPEGGRLVLPLDPGEHKYAANAPGVPTGSGGEFTLIPGGFVAKAARLEKTPLKVDSNGIVIAVPEDYVYVFDFDPFATPVVDMPVIDTWEPAAAIPNQGSIIWVNYYGNDELTIDLEGQLYKVPPQTDGVPGRLQVDLPPGFYRYTVSVPRGSINGEANVIPGQVTALNVTADVSEPQEYDLGDEFEPLPSIALHLAPADLTNQVSVTEIDTAPAELPVTGGEAILAPVNTSQGLLVKNYAGDTLIFTINNQTYAIANNTEQSLDLPPGQYNYTASLPFVATTGTVNLMVDQGLELSIAIDVNQNILNVYPN
ncbi:hypothetical protein ACFLXQ_03415 [Chloroflexota bacterium]